MHQTKLIQLLKCFSAKEIKHFDEFLQTPYFNKNEALISFFGLLATYHPEMKSAKLDREKVYARLYGPGPYKDKTIRVLSSELFKLAKTFLAHEELGKDELEASALRFKWLSRQNLKKMAMAELETQRARLDAYESHDFDYYHHLWTYDRDKFDLAIEQFRNAQHKLLTEFDVLAQVHSLNRDYLVNSFMRLYYLLAMSGIYKFSIGEEYLEQIDALAQPYINKGDMVMDIFYNTFKLQHIDDEKYFYELKARFFANDRSVPLEVMYTAGTALWNYTAKKLREGKEQFNKDVKEIYHFQDENNLHLEYGKMAYGRYFNVVTRGIETDDLDWVDKFVEDNKKYLDAEHMEDAYRYAKAHILFARKQYEDALRLGLSCNIHFFIAKVVIRMLVIRIHYELDMMNELHLELDALKYHIKDEKIPDERGQHLLTFVTTMRQLADLKTNYSPEKQGHLLHLLGTQKGMPNEGWFRRKIQELEDAKGRKNNSSG